jgi:NAD(P)-dependent dehydrogenase (short-subunit alcohol dehydrogenase family)
MKQVWLITGSSRGLGRQLAEAVLAEGYRLLATARDPSKLADLVDRYCDRIRAFALDVTDEQAARDAINAAVEAFGRLDVLVNNAGYGNIGSIEDTELSDFRAQIETNLFGVINVTKAPYRFCVNRARATSFSSHPLVAASEPWGERLTPLPNGAWKAFLRCWPRK